MGFFQLEQGIKIENLCMRAHTHDVRTSSSSGVSCCSNLWRQKKKALSRLRGSRAESRVFLFDLNAAWTPAVCFNNSSSSSSSSSGAGARAATAAAAAAKMVSAELLWQCVRKSSCFLKRSNNIVLTNEPLNLTQKNTLRHSGLCHQQPIGLDLVCNAAAVKLQHKVKAGRRMRYPRRVLLAKKFSKNLKNTKELQKLVAAQRPDLVCVAKRRFHKLCRTSPKAAATEQ
ncbi:hypothetical protein Esti_003221 [Eimeria stiedai]